MLQDSYMIDKNKTRQRTYKAIVSGEIIRKPCDICGAEKVDAHHPDYSDYLSVMWLCRKHHTLVTTKRMCLISERPWRDESKCRVLTYLITPGQALVLREVLNGHSNKDIAAILNMSVYRVKSFVYQAYRNLGISHTNHLFPILKTIKQEFGWL